MIYELLPNVTHVLAVAADRRMPGYWEELGQLALHGRVLRRSRCRRALDAVHRLVDLHAAM